jgi:multisubunit Na+/H+ antiporter MnhB subunit
MAANIALTCVIVFVLCILAIQIVPDRRSTENVMVVLGLTAALSVVVGVVSTLVLIWS